MYSILLSPSSDFNSDNLFSESSIIFTYAPFAWAFFMASVPATPAPITVTTLGSKFETFPSNVPFPLLCFNKLFIS